MKSKTATGCTVAAVIVLAIGAAFILIVGIFYTRASKHRQNLKMEAHGQMVEAEVIASAAPGAGPVIILGNGASNPPPYTGAAPLSREQYLAFKTDGGMTDLGRTEFRKMADDKMVSWTLRTKDISESNNKALGKFDLPYQIRTDNHTSSSSIPVNVTFSDGSREPLLRIRKHDWVEIEGRVAFNGYELNLVEARVKEAP